MAAHLAIALRSDVLSILAVFAFAVVLILIWFLGTMHRMALLLATVNGINSASGEEKTNCPSCGARTTVEPDECDYCGELLAADEPPEYGWDDG